jgi:hypothetical protein
VSGTGENLRDTATQARTVRRVSRPENRPEDRQGDTPLVEATHVEQPVRPVLRWAKRLVAVVAGVAVAVGAAWWGAGGLDATEAVVAVVFGALLGVSWLGMRRLDPVLGPVTACVAVVVVWGVAAFLVGVAAPGCPGSGPGRCSMSQAATLGLTGAMTPAAMFAVLVPPVLMWRTGRGMLSLRARLRARLDQKPAVSRTASPGHGTTRRTNGPGANKPGANKPGATRAKGRR